MGLTVYEEPVRTRYTANSTGAHLLQLVAAATVLIVPFVIAFSMGQFWRTSSTMVALPEVAYTGKMIARVTTASGRRLVFVSSPTVMAQLDVGLPETATAHHTAAMHPAITLLRDDHDGDGTTDRFLFGLRLEHDILADPIVSACLLPEFEYQYKSPELFIKMTAAPLVCAESNDRGPYEAAVVLADLNLHETKLVEASVYVRYDRIYADSLFPQFSPIELAELTPVAFAYSSRNLSLSADPKLSQFGGRSILSESRTMTDTGLSLGTFTLEAIVRNQPQVVRYVPAWYENIKFGWVQYFCVAYVVYWIMEHVRAVFVKQAIINTIAIWENRARN